jgi:hypothetical protein
VNAAAPPARLDEALREFELAHACGMGRLCDCEMPPESALCVDGRCTDTEPTPVQAP